MRGTLTPSLFLSLTHMHTYIEVNGPWTWSKPRKIWKGQVEEGLRREDAQNQLRWCESGRYDIVVDLATPINKDKKLGFK